MMGAFESIRAIAVKGAFACQGDVLLAMGGRCLSAADVNAAIASGSLCERCASGWRVTSTDVFGDLIILELRIEPHTVISIGPSL